jgi:hypothetical protein
MLCPERFWVNLQACCDLEIEKDRRSSARDDIGSLSARVPVSRSPDAPDLSQAGRPTVG